MKRIQVESVEHTPVISRGSAVTLGVFDGMHKGHQEVLDLTVRVGRRLEADTVMVTFDLHPEHLLNSHHPAMILTLEHRLRLMERCGIDLAVIIPFDEKTRNMKAQAFLDAFLLGALNLKAIILGHDSAFGRNREGNLSFLERVKGDHGFEVHQAPEVMAAGATISSTRIREAILEGDLVLVEQMLGRALSLFGKVVPGDGRGKTIGYPTANLDCGSAILPPHGVYSVKVMESDVLRRGVMNVGSRPTFYADTAHPKTTVEVHIPEFSADLYGKDLEVFVTRKIREELRFSSVEELIEAIRQDIAAMD